MAVKERKRRGGDGWLGATVSHQGFPMALRVRSKIHTAETRARFQRLAAITHRLAEVRANGLPKSRYNDGLAQLDADVIRALESEDGAVVVIVETFAGKRTYYAYADGPGRAKAALARLREAYPQHDLTAAGGPDPDWGLYSEYRERWPW